MALVKYYDEGEKVTMASNIDRNIMLTINAMPDGPEKEANKEAYTKYPTLKTDCRLARLRKEALRNEYIKRLLQ